MGYQKCQKLNFSKKFVKNEFLVVLLTEIDTKKAEKQKFGYSSTENNQFGSIFLHLPKIEIPRAQTKKDTKKLF